MSTIIHNFLVYNQNAFNKIVYLCTTNWWLIITFVCMLTTMFFMFKEAVRSDVREDISII